MFEITKEAAQILDTQHIVRETDRSGYPHLLVKVPDMDKVPDADIGIEVRREDDNSVAITVLLYDIPTEPVSYEMRFYPAQPRDLGFLHSFIDAARFRLHPCAYDNGQWIVGTPVTFRVPANVLLRLKHFSLDWPELTRGIEVPPEASAPEAAEPVEPSPSAHRRAAPPAADSAQRVPYEPRPERSHAEPMLEADPLLGAIEEAKRVAGDPRDTVIQRLKEQVETMRKQVQEKDKRIIELEDEVAEMKSGKRGYKLTGDKKNWWKPF